MTKEKPLQFAYKYSHNTLECWKSVDLRRKTKGRPVDMGLARLPPLYSGPRQISSAKLADLRELLCFVPPVYHGFYTVLTAAAEGSDLDSDSGSDNETSDSESDMENDEPEDTP